jgi:hypothetical protein
MSRISGIRDLDREILSKLDDKELLKVCSIDKYTWNTVCDDAFLKRRLLNKYPEIEKYKNKRETWKYFFSRAVRYISFLKEEYDYEYVFGNFMKQDKLLEKYKHTMNTLLLEATSNQEFALVIWSLKNGANIHSVNEALISSSRIGNFEIVKYLLNNGADIHTAQDYSFRLASSNGHLEIVKYLLEHGADIHANNDDALRWACYQGLFKIVKYLVEHGAIINNTILDYTSKHPEILDYLEEHGSNVHSDND